VLTVSAALDRERRPEYELKIRASDSGKEKRLSSLAVVRVDVDDVNDNAPKFALVEVNVKVREDVPRGTVVAVLAAVDPDLGQGGEVRYALASTSSPGVFIVDKLTGTVRTAAPLDFEQRQLHEVVLRARDRGTPSLTADATLKIEVVDVNENRYAPHFSDFVFSARVRENLPAGTHVTRVAAIDKDPPGDDSSISYSIRGGDGLGLFAIDNHGKCIIYFTKKIHFLHRDVIHCRHPFS
jgi:protocadherin Fat 1/2/3